MRVMLDTNVLVSAFIFKGKTISTMIDLLTEYHTIVIPSYVLNELKDVVHDKFPEKYSSLDIFLANLPFEYAYISENLDAEKYPALRDNDDLPVLASAILENVDILLTGDKDFAALEMKHPLILTPAQFVAKFS